MISLIAMAAATMAMREPVTVIALDVAIDANNNVSYPSGRIKTYGSKLEARAAIVEACALTRFGPVTNDPSDPHGINVPGYAWIILRTTGTDLFESGANPVLLRQNKHNDKFTKFRKCNLGGATTSLRNRVAMFAFDGEAARNAEPSGEYLPQNFDLDVVRKQAKGSGVAFLKVKIHVDPDVRYPGGTEP